MSAKTVRFADENFNRTYPISNSFGGSLPPLTMSSSSSSSSSGPITPPSLFGGSPSGYRPLPMKDDALSIHEALSAVQGLRYDFDISADPAITLFDCPYLKPHILREPATSPPVQEIYVVSRFLPWKLQVLPSKSSDFVTVSDVLGGLYCALRLPVKVTEYDCQRPQMKAAVSKAFNRRVHKLGRIDTLAAETERQKGMKRIDFMMGNHHFTGLSYEGGRPNELTMHISTR